MELQILLFIWILPFQATANLERQYIYVQKDMTWTEALDYCARNNSVISALSNKDLTSIRACNQSTKELWTSSYVYATPYISIIGCFRNTTATSLNFSSLLKPSILDCQDLCSSSSLFAIMDKKCACLDNINSAVEITDAYLCDVPCDGPFWCGGKDSMNVYSVVEDFFSRRQRLANPDFTSCVSYQCVDNRYVYKEVDCSSENISEAACSTFFSCTFEPGEPCFLFQAKNDEHDWTITVSSTGIGPQEAYQGSYFAFVNDSSGTYKQGSRTTLGSNIDFPDSKDSDWCLRFWTFLPNTSDVGRLQVYTEKTGEKLFIKNFTNRQDAEWNYAEFDIQVHKNDRIFFESVRGVNGSHFAVDDITLIKGKCRNTHSSVLYMTGEVKCNFEGNKDICFDQDQKDNFDWIIARNEQKIRDQKTGPMSSIEGNYYSYINTSDDKERRNSKAVLISKFYLTDVTITFSMQYHMNGKDINTLRVYLKNGMRELDFFRRTGNQREDWLRISFTVKIEGTWKLFISANKGYGPLGNIAIDDIQIKINRQDLKYNWMNQNERCKHNLGAYAINHQQLPDQPCFSFDFNRWTGIIRPQRRGSAINVLAKHPTKVKIYRNLGGNYEYVWESFNLTFTRRFICEKT
ncbi:MAM and LDL-receptor class A domain-containing protein 1-like isoform X2 [Saccostrea cucullata]|uniref:MAM and LDL-receptor class A domain-containing protein 1-like isoform X2 n=1 Tax=Saccostrea cuccullata TaxID=36930 RepID=UPI002ED2F3E0